MLTKSRFGQSWQLEIAVLLTLLGVVAGASERTFAQSQIVPDNTLGNERSVVLPLDSSGWPIDVIDGGAIRSLNLFHSFREFNVSQGREVYFFSPSTAIENILARVTGNNPSKILGVLGTFGNSRPNLFLINPNGILFGENASLDVDGSFVATTANAIRFGNNGFFSASNPEIPSSLLTINPSALFFNQVTPAPIQSNSVAPAGIDPLSRVFFERSFKGLRVRDGNSLLLVGGDVSINGGGRDQETGEYGGGVFASGGRVELGGLASIGTVGLNVDGKSLSLSFPEGIPRADISLINSAQISVIATEGGSIAINSRNLDIEEFSIIRSGILPQRGVTNSEAGNIEINAQGRVNIHNFPIISNAVFPGARGQAGDILINADLLSLTNGGQINVNTVGLGDSGNIIINVREGIFMDSSLIAGTVEFRGRGKGGGINISTGSLIVKNGSRLATSSSGIGNAGNITIEARDQVSFEGRFTDNDSPNILQDNIFNDIDIVNGIPSTATSILGFTGEGRGGDIRISTGSLSVTTGAELASSTRGFGNAGNITIEARDRITFDNDSVARSRVENGGVGKGGDISIDTRELIVSQGSQLLTSTNSFSRGDAGSIRIQATDFVSVSGTNLIDGVSSGLFTSTAFNSRGKGGDITVKTSDLRISDGAVLDARTRNDGGGGDIRVNADFLEAINGGQMLTTTFGSGRAGNIAVNVTNRVIINGSDVTFNQRLNQFGDNVVNIDAASGFFANTDIDSTGDGGTITLTTNNFDLTNAGKVSAQSQGTGTAGNINIDLNELLSATNSNIVTAAQQSDGGAIAIKAGDIRLYGNSDITTNVGSGTGGGGDITLTAASIIAFGDSDILTFASDGKGGNITFNTPGFFGQNYQPAPDNIDPRNLNGNNRVDINASGAVSGVITLPDTSFIQNSLSELPDNVIDTSSLIANSCIARNSRQQQGTFVITGSGGLPSRPGDALMSQYTFGTVRTNNPTASTHSTRRPWQKGDPIIEPQDAYRLSSGQIVLSRECL